MNKLSMIVPAPARLSPFIAISAWLIHLFLIPLTLLGFIEFDYRFWLGFGYTLIISILAGAIATSKRRGGANE